MQIRSGSRYQDTQQDYQMSCRDVISTDKRTPLYVYSAPQGILTQKPKRHTAKFYQEQIRCRGRDKERERERLSERSRQRDRGTKTETDKERQRRVGMKEKKEEDKSKLYQSCFFLPVESSCRPTSKDSLSVCDLDVFKQARYCGQHTHIKPHETQVSHAHTLLCR